MNKKDWTQINLHVLLPIFIGASIYLLFRNNRLLVFSWIDSIGARDIVFLVRNNVFFLRKHIPDFFIYSLPDGIWVYSGTFAFIIVWRNCLNNPYSFFWIVMPFLCSLGAEILQLFGIVKGTFCLLDIASYILFFCLALYFNNRGRVLWAIKY